MKTKAELKADLSKYTEVLFAMSAALMKMGMVGGNERAEARDAPRSARDPGCVGAASTRGSSK